MVTEYVRIHVKTGSTQALTDAPESVGAGWFSARVAVGELVEGWHGDFVAWHVPSY